MIYIILTTISTLAKLLAFTKIKRIYNNSSLHKIVLFFVTILISQSTFELALYFYASTPESVGAYYSLIGYYICLFGVITCLPFIAITIANIRINIYMTIISISFIAIIIFSLIFTDWLISGVKLATTTGSLTKVAGKYYIVFQITALLSVFFTIVKLSPHNKYKDYFIRIRTINLLIAFIPVFLFATFILFVMALGIPLNAVGILPFCFLIYVAALIHNMHPDKQPDYLVFIPFTKKNKILGNMLHDLIYTQRGINEKALNNQLIDYYLAQPGLTQKEVARILNMSESTLSRRKKNQKKK